MGSVQEQETSSQSTSSATRGTTRLTLCRYSQASSRCLEVEETSSGQERPQVKMEQGVVLQLLTYRGLCSSFLFVSFGVLIVTTEKKSSFVVFENTLP